MALITRTQFENEVELHSTEHQLAIDAWVVQVSAAIADHCGQPIEEAEQVVEFQGNGLGRRAIGYHPAVATALERESGFDSWTDVESPYRIAVVSDVPTLLYDGTLTDGVLYRLTATIGYAANAIPQPVQRAALVALMEWYKRSERGEKRGGVDSITKSGDYGNITQKFISEMPDVVNLLMPYRRRMTCGI